MIGIIFGSKEERGECLSVCQFISDVDAMTIWWTYIW